MRRLLPLCIAILLLAAPALAQELRVSASADPGLPQAQARQQALERALAEAVHKAALSLPSGPLPEARVAALRAHLAPRALDFVQAYQELRPDKTDKAEGQAKDEPLVLELDVTVLRAPLRQAMLRLGFLSGPRHPGAYALRLGLGVQEKDLAALEPANLLLGLSRSQQAQPGLPEVTLERLPQGYCKAVLRQGGMVLAVDAPELPALWLKAWGDYFADPRTQPGPGVRRLAVTGFAGVDAVQDFQRLLASWDDALQNPVLEGLDLDGGLVSARFSCRVLSQERLDARLREVLPARKLRLAGQSGGSAP